MKHNCKVGLSDDVMMLVGVIPWSVCGHGYGGLLC